MRNYSQTVSRQLFFFFSVIATRSNLKSACFLYIGKKKKWIKIMYYNCEHRKQGRASVFHNSLVSTIYYPFFKISFKKYFSLGTCCIIYRGSSTTLMEFIYSEKEIICLINLLSKQDATSTSCNFLFLINFLVPSLRYS